MNQRGRTTDIFLHVLVSGAMVLFLAAPAGAQLRAQEIASGFERPVAIVPDPLLPDTLIVVQQGGRVLAVVNGVPQSTPFLDLTSLVTLENEQGMLGLVFSPDGSRVYVTFVNKRVPDQGIGDLVVARFRRSANPRVLNASSRFDLVWPDGNRFIFQATRVHKGGNLVFGPDGYLYLGLGDGGGGSNSSYGAQVPTQLVGKMLRIDVNVPDVHPRGYVVPPDNPFVDNQPIAALDEIWSFGLRNPWRFSFDDFGLGATNALIIGDVGEASREEIDYEPAGRGGRNYGWFMREGFIATPVYLPGLPPAYTPLTDPMVDYPRQVGASVTGGYVYRGGALPSTYRGRYFMADFFGRVFSLGLTLDGNGEGHVADVLEHTSELGNPSLIPTFGRGLDGELYFASFTSGSIFKIVADGALLPPTAPTGLSSSVSGSTVTLSWQPGQGGGVVASYQLEAGSQPGASDLVVTQTLVAGLTAIGVPDGVYYVRVRSVNAAGVSEPSPEIAVTVGCVGPPSAPVGLTAQVLAGRFVSLTWNPVPAATGYRVEAGSSSGGSNVAIIPVSAPALSGVVPPATYFVRVRALTECGVSAPSAEIIVSVP